MSPLREGEDLVAARYQLIEVIGRGSMGTVWRAHDTLLDRPVALKEVEPAAGVAREEARERLLVEARAAARLRHPNIVAVHDVLVDDDRLLISMELVDGPTLGEMVSSSGPLPPALVREIMAQVAHALAAAHRAGVVHRDLKPDNVFWASGRAVVADFGLARVGAGRGTVIGTVMGTPGYMAPEQLQGLSAGPGVDVFGWGVTAYELITGRPPFGHPSDTDPAAIAYRVVHEAPEIATVPSDPGLAALIGAALSKDAADRPADGAAIVASLQADNGPDAVGRHAAPSPAVGRGDGAPRPSRNPAAVGLVALAVVAALVVGALVLGGNGGEGRDASPAPTTSPPTTSAPTTTIVPVPFPDQRGPVAAGTYLTVTMPAMTFRLGEGWQALTAGRTDELELAGVGDDQQVLSLVRLDNVYTREYVPPDGQRDPPGSTVTVPADVLAYLAENQRLAVTDRRTELLNGRTVVSAEVDVSSGYKNPVCQRQSAEGLCVILFQTVGGRFLIASGNRNRVFVLRTAGSTVVAVVEARPENYDSFLARARGVLATLGFPE